MRKHAFRDKVQSLYFLNPKFKVSAIFCGYAALFVSNLVGNREDRFYCVMPHSMPGNICFLIAKPDLHSQFQVLS